jgi:hypothetical protein
MLWRRFGGMSAQWNERGADDMLHPISKEVLMASEILIKERRREKVSA